MNAFAVPFIASLEAPVAWGTVDFISDLHLQPGEPATFDAWCRYLRQTPADAVFMLGDLFEAWVGDDAAAQPGLPGQALREMYAASRDKAVFFMHGNRDFLVGEAFMRESGCTLLHDPTVLDFAGVRWLLSHGDALCLADTDYLAFRAQVRQPQWQADFLARPLAERQAMARSMRSQSEAHQRAAAVYADVDTQAALAWLRAAGAPVLIHGHTHRPADHVLDEAHRRIVLSDWDAAATPPRLEVLRIDAAGARRLPLP